MPGNSLGQNFRITTFGESHGPMIGVVIDGCPAGLEIDFDFIQSELRRRRPGQSLVTTQRDESDQVRFVSGVFEGKTTGTPLAAWVENHDVRSQDYDAESFRPSHADYTYEKKYGHRDPRGGGRSSARETVARVVAGGVAKLFLKKRGVEVLAYVSQIGELRLKEEELKQRFSLGLQTSLDSVHLLRQMIEKNPVRCPDEFLAQKMVAHVQSIQEEGDSLGGVISGWVCGLPVGLGEPVFDRLQADLAKALFSIQTVKGFEYGSGFAGANLLGSQHNDAFALRKGETVTLTNHSGGIQGGISNGMDINFRVAFKPVSTIKKSQASVDRLGNSVIVQGKGRHDPCVVPRAVPIVEAMVAITLMDHWLRQFGSKEGVI